MFDLFVTSRIDLYRIDPQLSRNQEQILGFSLS
jgi:hypothetical protein